MAAEVASPPISYSSVVCSHKDDAKNKPLPQSNIAADDSKENVQPVAEQNGSLEASSAKDGQGNTEKQISETKHYVPAPPPKINVWQKRMEDKPPVTNTDTTLPKAELAADISVSRANCNTQKTRTVGGAASKGSKISQNRGRIDSRRSRQNKRETHSAGRPAEVARHVKSEAKSKEPLKEQKNEPTNVRKVEAAPPPKINVWKKPVAQTKPQVDVAESVPVKAESGAGRVSAKSTDPSIKIYLCIV